MKEYYFLASLLPPLEIGHMPALGFVEMKELMRLNLSSHDQKIVKRFLRQIDLENLRAYLAGQPLDPRGNLNEDEIEQALLNYAWPDGEEFPDFLSEFLDKHHTSEDRLAHFSRLLSQFLEHFISEEEGFLREYFDFQREWRYVMVGFRAKKQGRDVARELQFEDVTDPIIAQILAQKDAKTYEPPFEYKELKPLFETYSDQPLELHKALYEYQFHHIIEVWGGEIFSIDRILSYLARLILVERFMALDVAKGVEIIDTIEKEVS